MMWHVLHLSVMSAMPRLAESGRSHDEGHASHSSRIYDAPSCDHQCMCVILTLGMLGKTQVSSAKQPFPHSSIMSPVVTSND